MSGERKEQPCERLSFYQRCGTADGDLLALSAHIPGLRRGKGGRHSAR